MSGRSRLAAGGSVGRGLRITAVSAVAVVAFTLTWLAAGELPWKASAPVREPAPEGMVYIPGGTTHIGSHNGPANEQPVFRVEVAPFFMDAHPVTVGQFREFIEATGYVTEAERYGDAGVYDPETGGWNLVAGASWHYPAGPDGPPAPGDHPVTQVSWNDALAYARWASKRLPTEIEWEHAARNARDDLGDYPWGDRLHAGGHHHANIWQGSFPGNNTAEDGFLFTSPVGSFGKTELGLSDMAGNVWEWTADGYRSYGERGPNPGPAHEKVLRGGSFLCHESYCSGYRVSARSHSSPDTSLFHIGFRLVHDSDGTRAR